MNKQKWKPWHQVVKLREDLKSGELSLSMFAADLYDVALCRGNKIYSDPKEFFSFTYPTFNIRELSKDVAIRLAGESDRAVRQLELTYGGGKTHCLITLYHLFNRPEKLPNIQSVKEFIEHIGVKLPKARIAILPFDKIDVEKGVETYSPAGEKRWLRNPWSILAFQIAGSDGIRILNSQEKDEERETAPAENLLTSLLQLPEKEGLSTLILIDEVLMYAREKIAQDPLWRIKLINFFQYLTQAATKVRKCAMVASLLATDPRKNDDLGKQITQELYAIFRRERDESVQPVLKEDVAEVLRRRFFTPDSIMDREAFRPHVLAALKGISEFDEQIQKEGKGSEDKYLKSYPFHPDLTEVFYTKWTNLEGFQRTRGVLRTYALALREAEKWDISPLIGPNVFLESPEKSSISPAARELTIIAETEESHGRKQDWSGILESELAKAIKIQSELGGLKNREIEQAVFTVFLHSQPIGQKVLTEELLTLISACRPDKIELLKGLTQWIQASWFLDEEISGEINSQFDIPKAWRLGTRPNLRQMHYSALSEVAPSSIENRLIDEIAKLKNLTAGTGLPGVKVHKLPDKPSDVSDDGDFHFVILGPKAASEPDKPSIEAKRFIEETTGPDRPRIYRNAIVLATPSKDGLEIARDRIRDCLAWDEVRNQLRKQDIDATRNETLNKYINEAQKKVPDAVQQAYCLVVSVSAKNEIQAFRISVGTEPLFSVVKKNPQSRIQDSPINAEAILPGGPYNLWQENESFRRVKDLVRAFAQFPHLPKMLNSKESMKTLVEGMEKGIIVLRITRPDHTHKTYWCEEIDETVCDDPSLEAFLPKSAKLTNIKPSLLIPNFLPGLWDKTEINVKRVVDYFSGTNSVKIKKEGYTEEQNIPEASRLVVEDAIKSAVAHSLLWLVSGQATLLGEEVPLGIITDDAILQSPPQPISPTDILPPNLPEAWKDNETTAFSLSVALSKTKGKNLPWQIVRNTINQGIIARYVEIDPSSVEWPCEYSNSRNVHIKIPTIQPGEGGSPPQLSKYVAEGDLRPSQIQDLSDVIDEIQEKSAGLDLKLRLRIEISRDPTKASTKDEINKILKGIDQKLELK